MEVPSDRKKPQQSRTIPAASPACQHEPANLLAWESGVHFVFHTMAYWHNSHKWMSQVSLPTSAPCVWKRRRSVGIETRWLNICAFVLFFAYSLRASRSVPLPDLNLLLNFSFSFSSWFSSWFSYFHNSPLSWYSCSPQSRSRFAVVICTGLLSEKFSPR